MANSQCARHGSDRPEPENEVSTSELPRGCRSEARTGSRTATLLVSANDAEAISRPSPVADHSARDTRPSPESSSVSSPSRWGSAHSARPPSAEAGESTQRSVTVSAVRVRRRATTSSR